ncbi:MAG: peptidoglycan DD-metalloendopeptidase family protein [Lutisporaceae bacterium]
MKKAYVKHKRKHATFMYIPESESKVVSLRIPLWLPKTVVIGLVLLLLGTSASIYMLNSISKEYDKSNDEIDKLATVNTSQKQEIDSLQDKAQQIQLQLEENVKALDEIKKLVGLKASSSTDTKETPTPQPTSSDTSKSESDDATQQISQIKTSYAELSVATLSQKEAIDNSITPVKNQVAFLNAKPSIKPVGTRITASYGYRRNPFTNRGSEFHRGIDFAGDTGTSIKSTGDGVVIFAGWQSGYGKVVIISHGYGYTTLYGHNSKLLVEKGDKVKRGEIISKMGSTGRSTGSHLHYEVRLNGTAVNPSKYF